MESESHSLGIIPIALSKLLERFAYYGMRSMIIMYMIDKLMLSNASVTGIYSLFILAAGILPALGGLIGDTLLSSKNTAIIGGFIQALGFFVLIIPIPIAVYIGLFLVALGSGLYGPNTLSLLGNLYKDRTKKLDAAFSILYISINLGAFLGGFILAFISKNLSYNTGFVVCGIVMIGSQLLLLLPNNLLKGAPLKANMYSDEEKKESNVAMNMIIIITTILCVSTFWVLFQFANNPIYDRLPEISTIFSSFYTVFDAANAFSLIFAGIIFALIYSFIKTSSLLKILIGFIIFALSFALLGTIYHREISTSFIGFLLFAVLLQSIAELFIAPASYSIICTYGSKKFNATLFGAYVAITTILSHSASYLYTFTNRIDSTVMVIISIVLLLIFAAIFLIFYLLKREKKTIA